MDGSGRRRLEYLRACYESDNRATGILDLFHDKVEHLHFFTGTEVLVSGLLDRTTVPYEIGLVAEKAASLYQKERSLVYCAFPITGWLPASSTRLAAPLLFFPAALETEEVAGEPVTYIRADLEQPRINFPALASLVDGTETTAAFLEQLLARVPDSRGSLRGRAMSDARPVRHENAAISRRSAG